MAKKQQREIEKVELKNPNEPIDVPRLGLYITKDNLTIDRYRYLTNISHHYEQFFKVTYKTKKDEPKVDTQE